MQRATSRLREKGFRFWYRFVPPRNGTSRCGVWSQVPGPWYAVRGMRLCDRQNLREQVRSARKDPTCGPLGAGGLPLWTDVLVKDKLVYRLFWPETLVYLPKTDYIHQLLTLLTNLALDSEDAAILEK